MGIVRSRLHKRKVSGGITKICRKRRNHESGRLAANTKIGSRRVASVRVRGGNTKLRALRLDAGNFAWGTEAVSEPARILSVAYNATSNELVRTQTLVKNCIVSVDATPFKQYIAKHYGIDYDANRKVAEKKDDKKGKDTKKVATFDVTKASKAVQRKWALRNAEHKIDKSIEDQLKVGRLLCRLTTRPGQTGRADGAVLEGAELQFYLKKVEKKK